MLENNAESPADGSAPPRALFEGGFLASLRSMFSSGSKEASLSLEAQRAVNRHHRKKNPMRRHHKRKVHRRWSFSQSADSGNDPSVEIPEEHDELQHDERQMWEEVDARAAAAPQGNAPVSETVPQKEENVVQTTAKIDVIEEDDAFLKSATQKQSVSAAPKKKWSLFKSFSRWKPFARREKDSFLKRAAQTAETPVPTEVSRTTQTAELLHENAATKEDIEELKREQELAKKREEAFQQELERQKQELARRDGNQSAPVPTTPTAVAPAPADTNIGKLLPAEQPKPKEEPKTVVVKKKAVVDKPSGMAAFMASLNHFGMGKERTMFVQNLGTMLGAGLSLVDSLRTLQKETRNKQMKKLIQRIVDEVENGYPLWRAMEHQYFFTPHALALVRIGEEAGNLAENVVYLSQQEEKDNALRGKVKMAMIYPTIVMVLMFIIVVGLGTFVLPQLIGVLTSLDVELPFATRMVILFTKMFTEYGAIFVPGCIITFVSVSLLSKFTNFKVVTQWLMFHVPGIGQLAKEATIARFGVILGGLLKAGVPVVEAMESLVQVTPIVTYKKLYAQMLEHILLGDSFAKSFGYIKHSEKLLPPSVQQLVITGEQSGALADIMLKISDIYDKKASDTAQKLPVILEPMLLLFIGGLVGTIAFAIIVPIYSIVGNVG